MLPKVAFVEVTLDDCIQHKGHVESLDSCVISIKRDGFVEYDGTRRQEVAHFGLTKVIATHSSFSVSSFLLFIGKLKYC